MSLKIDQVQLDIIINSDPSRVKLTQLNDELKNAQKEFKKVQEGTQEWYDQKGKIDEIKNKIDETKREIGLTGMSVKELTSLQKELNKTMSQMNPNTDIYKVLQSELSEVNTRIKELKGTASEMGPGGILGQIFGVAGGIGIEKLAEKGIEMGKKLFEGIMNSSESMKDKYKTFMTEAEFATKSFYNSLSDPSKWGSLITNMEEAIKKGKDYQETMNNISKEQRALDYVHTQDLIQMTKLEEKLKTGYDPDTHEKLTNQQRLDAGQQLIKQTEAYYKQRQDLAEKAANADLKAIGLTKDQMQQYLELDVKTKNLREDAEKYNVLLKKIKNTKEFDTVTIAETGQSRTVDNSEKIKQANIELAKYSDQVKLFAKLMTEVEGNPNADLIDKTIEDLKKVNAEKYGAYEEDKRTYKAVATEKDKIDKEREEAQKKSIEDAKKRQEEADKKFESDLKTHRATLLTEKEKELDDNNNFYNKEVASAGKNMVLVNQLLEAKRQKEDEINKKWDDKELEATKKANETAYKESQSSIDNRHQSEVDAIIALKQQKDVTNLQLLISDLAYYSETLANQEKFGEKTLETQKKIDEAKRKINEIGTSLGVGGAPADNSKSKTVKIKEQENTQLAELDLLYKNGAIKTEQDLQDARKNITTKANTAIFQEQMKSVEKYGKYVEQILSSIEKFEKSSDDKKVKSLENEKKKELSLFKGTAAQKQKMSDDFDAKIEAQRKANFEKEKKWSIAMALVKGALAVINCFATMGPPVSFIMAAITAIATGLEVATISGEEYAEGNVDIIGQQTGKKYSAANKGKVTDTHFTDRPSLYLAGEEGPEMIVDARRTRQMQMNYPGLIEAIKQVPQYASGNIGSSTITTTHTQSMFTDPEMLAAIKKLNEHMDNGIEAKLDWRTYNRSMNKINNVVNNSTIK